MEATKNEFSGTGGIVEVDCPFCSETIKATARKCKHCGETLDAAMRKAEEALRASERGGNVYMNAAVAASPNSVRPPKSRGVAIVLALLLGGIGVHKFYLNRPGWGVLYLLFCWTFIPGIVALIEAIVYLCTSEDSFHYKYG